MRNDQLLAEKLLKHIREEIMDCDVPYDYKKKIIDEILNPKIKKLCSNNSFDIIDRLGL